MAVIILGEIQALTDRTWVCMLCKSEDSPTGASNARMWLADDWSSLGPKDTGDIIGFATALAGSLVRC